MRDDPSNLIGSVAVSATVTMMFAVVWLIATVLQPLQPYGGNIKIL